MTCVTNSESDFYLWSLWTVFYDVKVTCVTNSESDFYLWSLWTVFHDVKMVSRCQSDMCHEQRNPSFTCDLYELCFTMSKWHVSLTANPTFTCDLYELCFTMSKWHVSLTANPTFTCDLYELCFTIFESCVSITRVSQIQILLSLAVWAFVMEILTCIVVP